MAYEMDADEDMLLVLADKVPGASRKRIRGRPNLVQAIADVESLDQLTAYMPDRSGTSIQ